MPRLKAQKHITRTGWSFWVRFADGSQKSFSFNKYGGITKAYNAAVDWRDAMLTRPTYAPGKGSENYHKRAPTSANKTGVLGVSKVSDKRSDYKAYRVTWRETNEYGKRVTMTKDFSYTEGDFDSEHKAWKCAVKLRKRMEKVHYVGKQRARPINASNTRRAKT